MCGLSLGFARKVASMLSRVSLRRGYINCIHEMVDHFPTVIKNISLLRTVMTKKNGVSFRVEKLRTLEPKINFPAAASLEVRHFNLFHTKADYTLNTSIYVVQLQQ